MSKGVCECGMTAENFVLLILKIRMESAKICKLEIEHPNWRIIK